MIENMIRKFGQPLTVQRSTIVKDGAYRREVWADHTVIVGVFDDTGGTEAQSADSTNLTTRFKLFCFPADIKESDRVNVGGKTYNVLYVANPMLANRFFQIDLEFNQNEQV